MRLRRLDLTRYGKFTDHSIDFGARREGDVALQLNVRMAASELG